MILNYYGSWYRKDCLEVDLLMITIFYHQINGSAVHRSSKTWLVTAKPIDRVLLHTSFSTEGMAKRSHRLSEVSFAPSSRNSQPHMEVFLPRWPNFTNPATTVDLNPRCNPSNPFFSLFSNHSITFISFSTLLTNALKGKIF